MLATVLQVPKEQQSERHMRRSTVIGLPFIYFFAHTLPVRFYTRLPLLHGHFSCHCPTHLFACQLSRYVEIQHKMLANGEALVSICLLLNWRPVFIFFSRRSSRYFAMLEPRQLRFLFILPYSLPLFFFLSLSLSLSFAAVLAARYVIKA